MISNSLFTEGSYPFNPAPFWVKPFLKGLKADQKNFKKKIKYLKFILNIKYILIYNNNFFENGNTKSL